MIGRIVPPIAIRTVVQSDFVIVSFEKIAS